MKVLFLDVDGVLNTTRTMAFLGLSKPLLRNLEKIVKNTDCKIVLSSTWRKFNDSYGKLVRVLGYRGLSIYSKTPIMNREYDAENFTTYRPVRGDEIKKWLSEHPEVTDYAIVDDDGDMLDEQLRHFFQTDIDYGLTRTITYRIIKHLNPEYAEIDPLMEELSPEELIALYYKGAPNEDQE